jgi:hypothetical protein
MRGGLTPLIPRGRLALTMRSPYKATRHHAPDIYPFASDSAARQAAQRWAAGRRSALEALRFMAAKSERNPG